MAEISKCIFLNKVCILSNELLLNYFLQGKFENMSAWIQILTPIDAYMLRRDDIE